MKSGIIIFLFLISITAPGTLMGQSLKALVLESIFDLKDEEDEDILIRQLNLNQDSLFMVLENKVKYTLNLESIRLEQPSPFIFKTRNNKNFKELLPIDIEKAIKNPADLYLIFNLTIGPPNRSLIYPLVRNTMIFKIYIYDKDLNQIQKIKFRERITLGFFISSEDFTSDDYGSYEDLNFFRPNRNEFLELFDKVIKSEGEIRF